MDVFSIVCAVIAAASAVCGILSFLYGRKKEVVGEEKEQANRDKKNITEQIKLETTLEYIRDGVDAIRLDQKAQAAEIQKHNEKIIRLDEHQKEQDRRLSRLEGKVEDYD